MPHVPTIVQGEYWPSVTEVVNILDKPFLRKWYGTLGWEACEKKKKESGDRGKALHEQIEQALIHYGAENSLEESLKQPYANAAIRWAEITGFVPVSFEKHVKSKKYRYGGTYDCLGTMPDDVVVLPDWKFTGQLYNTGPLQLSGYAQAILESENIRVTEGRIVRFYDLKKEATEDKIKITKYGNIYKFKGLAVGIQEAVYPNLGFYFAEFERCRGLWDYINNKGAWANDNNDAAVC